MFCGNSNASFEAVVDDGSPITGLKPDPNFLYSRDDLSPGLHTVMLTSRAADSSTILSFEKAVIFNSEHSECVDTRLRINSLLTFLSLDAMPATRIDNSDSESINYVGAWRTSSGTDDNPFQLTETAGDYFRFNFTGGGAFAVRGTKSYAHQRYTVVSRHCLAYCPQT